VSIFRFEPDGARAASINLRMNRELGLSLQHISDQAGPAFGSHAQDVAPLIAHLIDGGNVVPGTFARYYELVEAIEGDDLDEARRLWAELADAGPPPSPLAVHELGGAGLGSESARYAALLNADAFADIGVIPPSPEAAAAFRTRLEHAFALLDQAAPDLSAEIRAILRQIVIVAGDPQKKFQMDAASHFQLWGALFLNSDRHPDRIAVAEVLAHENAHGVLFGLCIEEPLVRNGDDQLYASPLRHDPRPMDGIFHATFVSARMHWTMATLARSDCLSPDERERAEAAASIDAANFADGCKVVEEHADLTDLGRSVLVSTKRYMDRHA
jgi:HEXXH motif-containing protein